MGHFKGGRGNERKQSNARRSPTGSSLQSFLCHLVGFPTIPNEEKNLSDAIWAWAKAKGWLSGRMNEITCSCGGKPHRMPVISQASLCRPHGYGLSKRRPCVHDFKKDPLILEVSGDLLGTGGRTTLGADDGIGVALGLTIMENPPASHPELELLLTTDEEDTFSGAAAVDFSRIHGRQLLNLDHAREGQAIVGSAGGMGVLCQSMFNWKPSRNGIDSSVFP